MHDTAFTYSIKLFSIVLYRRSWSDLFDPFDDDSGWVRWQNTFDCSFILRNPYLFDPAQYPLKILFKICLQNMPGVSLVHNGPIQKAITASSISSRVLESSKHFPQGCYYIVLYGLYGEGTCSLFVPASRLRNAVGDVITNVPVSSHQLWSPHYKNIFGPNKFILSSSQFVNISSSFSLTPLLSYFQTHRHCTSDSPADALPATLRITAFVNIFLACGTTFELKIKPMICCPPIQTSTNHQ